MDPGDITDDNVDAVCRKCIIRSQKRTELLTVMKMFVSGYRGANVLHEWSEDVLWRPRA